MRICKINKGKKIYVIVVNKMELILIKMQSSSHALSINRV